MVMLSIVMPVYNESGTIRSAIERVQAMDYPCPVELVVVDDGSTDGTIDILQQLTGWGMRLIRHPRTLGKGAAVRSGVAVAAGSHMIILDADLEYSPGDIPAMLGPVLDGRADHVFGTRVFGLNTRYQSFRFAMGGRALTLAANILYDSCLTDMHTCLKLLPVADFRALRLSENGFGLDTELTARLIRSGMRPFEVPVSYDGRPFEQGKKIRWRDGVRCLSILIKVRVERYPQPLSDVARHRVLPQTIAHSSVATDESPVSGWRLPTPLVEIPPQPSDEGSDETAVAI
jgi:glycosyltransferase involved in cell wall biosynthesis